MNILETHKELFISSKKILMTVSLEIYCLVNIDNFHSYEKLTL